MILCLLCSYPPISEWVGRSEHHLSETAFSKSHFSKRPQEKYEHSKSLKKCHKNFEIGQQIKFYARKYF